VEVSTKATGHPAVGFCVRSPDELSEATMKSFGRGGFVVTPLLSHALVEWVFSLLPERVGARLLLVFLRRGLGDIFRRRAGNGPSGD